MRTAGDTTITAAMTDTSMGMGDTTIIIPTAGTAGNAKTHCKVG